MNLGGLLERTYRNIHDEIVDGVATAGTTTSCTDTAIVTKYPDAKFKNWTFFDSTTNQYAVVSGNINATGVISFPAIATAVAVNDLYAVVKSSIPLYTLIKLCNDALTMLGRIWQRDTSLSTLVSTRNYALPVAMKGADLKRVTFLDTNNYRYAPPPYEVLPAVGGTATTTLQFKGQPSTTKTIAIDYMAYHPALTSYSSAINETIPDELIVSAVTERALHWKMLPKRKKLDVDKWQIAKVDYQEAKTLYPILKPPLENQRVPIDVYNVI